MKPKMLLISSIILLSMIACKKNSVDILDNDIAIRYSDIIGNDLLNPSSQNAIREADINLFYLIDGIKKQVNDPDMDTPENFKIDFNEASQCYMLVIYLNDKYDANKLSETIIEFTNHSDTIKASWNVSENGSSIIYKNVWYNNQLKITVGPPQFDFEVVLE